MAQKIVKTRNSRLFPIQIVIGFSVLSLIVLYVKDVKSGGGVERENDEVGEVADIISPVDEVDHLGLAIQAEASGQLTEAAGYYEAYIRSSNENQSVEAFAGLVEQYLGIGDTVSAWRILDENLVERWPDSIQANYFLAYRILQDVGGKEDLLIVQSMLEKCVVADPRHSPSRQQLGICYHRLGMLVEAERELRGFLELQPNDFTATTRLGMVLSEAGKRKEAETLLRRQREVMEMIARRDFLAIRVKREEGEISDYKELAELHHKLGNDDAALMFLTTYQSKRRDDLDSYRLLNEVYTAMGKESDAKSARLIYEAVEKQ